MRKTVAAVLLVVLGFCLSNRSNSQPLDIPTGGGQISPPITATANGFFTGRSTFSVVLTTPSLGYQYCITHIAVTAPSQGQFEMAWATSTYSNPGVVGTTDYIVTIASSVPYDTQWAYRTPYCAPTNDLLDIYLGALPTVSTVTYEGYTYKGWNP